MKKDIKLIKLPAKEQMHEQDMREIKELLRRAADISDEHEFNKCIIFCLKDSDESIMLEYNVSMKDKMHASSILITDAVSENILKSVTGIYEDED